MRNVGNELIVIGLLPAVLAVVATGVALILGLVFMCGLPEQRGGDYYLTCDGRHEAVVNNVNVLYGFSMSAPWFMILSFPIFLTGLIMRLAHSSTPVNIPSGTLSWFFEKAAIYFLVGMAVLIFIGSVGPVLYSVVQVLVSFL